MLSVYMPPYLYVCTPYVNMIEFLDAEILHEWRRLPMLLYKRFLIAASWSVVPCLQSIMSASNSPSTG